MLWTLKHGIPSKMRKAHEIGASCRRPSVGRFIVWRVHGSLGSCKAKILQKSFPNFASSKALEQLDVTPLRPPTTPEPQLSCRTRRGISLRLVRPYPRGLLVCTT